MTKPSPAANTPKGAPTKPGKGAGAPAKLRSVANSSVFHQDWWLKAASGGACEEVRIEEAGAVVARLPYVASRRFGLTILKMPPFTHVLGPSVDCGEGKYQTLLKTRVKLTRQLLEGLPKFDYFFQICDLWPADGLTIADGLAFQECGYRIGTQYTFNVDCRKELDTLFGEMSVKSRQHVRMAQSEYSVVSIADPAAFTDFYLRSLTSRKLKSNIPLERFPALYAECRARDCADVLAAVDANGSPVAMTFLVWDDHKMYYLLSARSQDVPDKGSVNLLIWSAITKAHERGLVFDLDGVSTSGTAQFLAGFGGKLSTRMTVACARPVYSTVQHFARLMGMGNTSSFT